MSEVISDENWLPKEIYLTLGEKQFKITEPSRRVSRRIKRDIINLQDVYKDVFFDENGNTKTEDSMTPSEMAKSLDCADDLIDIISKYLDTNDENDIKYVQDNTTEEEIFDALTEVMKLVDPTIGEAMKEEKTNQKKNTTPTRKQKQKQHTQ